MRALARLSLGAHVEALPAAPETPATAHTIRSWPQLEALRETSAAARLLLPSMLGTSPGRRLDEVNFLRLARSLDWLDSLRASLDACGGEPVDVDQVEASDLWLVADASKALVKQLRELVVAREAMDTVAIERWCGRASVSVGLLAVALRMEVPRG